MAKLSKKIAMAATAIVMASSMVIGLAACDPDSDPYDIERKARTGWQDTKEYTYNDYTSQLPSLWNELASTDGNDANVYEYLESSFFEFDFKFDENDNIVPGEFVVNYSAATAIEDVTSDYVGQYGITQAMAAEGHHAFAITLRNDLKWDDGTPIKAEDFVFTMEQQLSPNYLYEQAANYWNGNYVMYNAKNYFYQGQSAYFDNGVVGFTYSDLSKDADGKYTLGGKDCYIALKSSLDYLDGDALNDYAKYLDAEAYASLLELADKDGNVQITDNSLQLLKTAINTAAWGNETEDNVINYMYVYYTYPELDFSEVGFFADAEDEYKLVVVITNTLSPIDDEGNLTYEAAYYFQGFPLVKKSLWQQLEDKTTTPYTNTYNSVSVSNSASWGPYKLTNYQADTTYTLSRNDNWFGYGLDQYSDQYQTDQIVVRKIAEWNTAWQAFQLGQVDTIGIDVTIADDYRTSSQAYYTPTMGVSQYFLQCNEDALTRERGNAMLKYLDFRKALSLGLDRSAWCTELTTSYLPYLGIYNDLIYYDVANGGVYRDTDYAKEVLLSVYGATKGEDGKWTVGTVKYDTLDEAVDALTGYNLTAARELLTSAYNAAKAAGDYVDGDQITLRFGVQQSTSTTQRTVNFLNTTWSKLAEGTPFEGKIKVEEYIFNADEWIDEFRKDGKYDIAGAYVSGGAWNPYYSLQIFLLDSQRLTLGWDPNEIQLTLTVPGGEGQDDVTATLGLVDWFNCVNGLDEGKYNLATYPEDSRLLVCAKLEQAILESYTNIPVASMYSSAIMSYKCDYVTYEYNTFMSYGGFRYMSYNFDDTEWAAFVSGVGGTLNYKH